MESPRIEAIKDDAPTAYGSVFGKTIPWPLDNRRVFKPWIIWRDFIPHPSYAVHPTLPTAPILYPNTFSSTSMANFDDYINLYPDVDTALDFDGFSVNPDPYLDLHWFMNMDDLNG